LSDTAIDNKDTNVFIEGLFSPVSRIAGEGRNGSQRSVQV